MIFIFDQKKDQFGHQINSSSFFRKKLLLENWLKRSPLISDRLAVGSIEFADLEECWRRVRKDPVDFVRRLCNLSQLSVSASLRDREHLFNLLNANRILKCLKLKVDADANQELLNGLPSVCPYIYHLETEVPGDFPKLCGKFYVAPGDWTDVWKKTETNYEFLSKFEFLASVCLGEIDSLEHIACLLKRNQRIVDFRLAGNMIYVTQNASREHKLIFQSELVFSSRNVDELVRLLRFENSRLPSLVYYKNCL